MGCYQWCVRFLARYVPIPHMASVHLSADHTFRFVCWQVQRTDMVLSAMSRCSRTYQMQQKAHLFYTSWGHLLKSAGTLYAYSNSICRSILLSRSRINEAITCCSCNTGKNIWYEHNVLKYSLVLVPPFFCWMQNTENNGDELSVSTKKSVSRTSFLTVNTGYSLLTKPFATNLLILKWKILSSLMWRYVIQPYGRTLNTVVSALACLSMK